MRPVKLLPLWLCLLFASCETTAMTHAQWKREQANKAASEQAGVEYKSPTQIKKEAEATREAVRDTRFEKEKE
jgi:hypothetical protein